VYTFTKLHNRRIPKVRVGVGVGPVEFSHNYTDLLHVIRCVTVCGLCFMYFMTICCELTQTNAAAWTVDSNVSYVCTCLSAVVGKPPQQMIISNQTDTQITIQRLCERIHQLEAVSSIILTRYCLLYEVSLCVFYSPAYLLNVFILYIQLQKKISNETFKYSELLVMGQADV